MNMGIGVGVDLEDLQVMINFEIKKAPLPDAPQPPVSVAGVAAPTVKRARVRAVKPPASSTPPAK